MMNYDKLLDEVRKKGMDYKWARMFVKKLADDEQAFSTSESEKRWALERGFYPGRIALYGLTDENYQDYVPDYNYFMLHPLNNHFLKWLDKTTLKYVLNSNGCEDTMPDYYIYIENDGSYTYLMNAPSHISKNSNYLYSLLHDKKILAMKPNSGTSGGLGFIKLELVDEKLFENNKLINNEKFEQIKDSMRNYIVTEYVHQHPSLASIWPDSECTLRVIMTKNPKQNLFEAAKWSCAVSYARFGTSISGGASNLSSGGVGVGFEFESGRYKDFGIRYKRFCENGDWIIDMHPDTKIKWREHILPNWGHVKSKIYDICDHVSSLDYLGMDIIITEDGMKLCEINSHPAMDYEQVMCGPVLQNPDVKEFFVTKGLFKYDKSDFCEMYLKSKK